ncbi:MAG: oxidoreductase, partial [Chryseobacterium sp.]|nr:oxidoreductase [Chryseobacterium sp.]
VGLITTAEQAEEILESGQADLIFLAREILRNPYFAVQAAWKHKEENFYPHQYLRAKPAK